MGFDWETFFRVAGGFGQGWQQGQQRARAAELQDRAFRSQQQRYDQERQDRITQGDLNRQNALKIAQLTHPAKDPNAADPKAAQDFLDKEPQALQQIASLPDALQPAAMYAHVQRAKGLGLDTSRYRVPGDPLGGAPGAAPGVTPPSGGAFGLGGPVGTGGPGSGFGGPPNSGGFGLPALGQAPDAPLSPAMLAGLLTNRAAAARYPAASAPTGDPTADGTVPFLRPTPKPLPPGAGATFTTGLPAALASVGLLPHSQQPGAMTALKNEGTGLGIDMSGFQVPGSQVGTRPLNWGKSPAEVAAINRLRATAGGDPNATITYQGKNYTPAQLDQAFPPGTAPVLAPWLTPSAKDQAGIDYKAKQTQMIDKNFGLKQAQFKSQQDYRAFVERARDRALGLQSQGFTERQAHDKTMEEIAAGHLQIAAGKQSAGLGGGTALDKEYEANLKRMTALSTPGKDPLTGQPTGDAPVKSSPAAQEEYAHLLNRNRQIRQQQQGGPAPQGGRTPYVDPSAGGYQVVPGQGRVKLPPSLGPLPPLGGSVGNVLSPRPTAPAKRSKYAGMSDAQLMALYRKSHH